MSKTTFLGYVPSLKSKHEATIVGHKAIQSKGGSIRYTLQGEYQGRKTLPKTVSKADFEGVYGFDAKEAESAIIIGKNKKGDVDVLGYTTDAKDKTGFTPEKIVKWDSKELKDLQHYSNHDADTVGNPSPASVEPPAPSESPFPQEPSNENFSAENNDNKEYHISTYLQEEIDGEKNGWANWYLDGTGIEKDLDWEVSETKKTYEEAVDYIKKENEETPFAYAAIWEWDFDAYGGDGDYTKNYEIIIWTDPEVYEDLQNYFIEQEIKWANADDIRQIIVDLELDKTYPNTNIILNDEGSMKAFIRALNKKERVHDYNYSFSAEMEEWNYVNFEVIPQGLKLTSNGRGAYDDVENAADLLEDVRANSDWEWLTADQLGGLSEADVLAQGSYSDDGDFEPAENVAYAYTDYQIKDWFQELKENGVVVFKPFPIEKSEVKEAFGFGKEEEESEEPKTQEFTVVMQEGDKLELTDITEEETEEQQPEDDEPKEEDSPEESENEEKEADEDMVERTFFITDAWYDTYDDNDEDSFEDQYGYNQSEEQPKFEDEDLTLTIDAYPQEGYGEISDSLVDALSNSTGFGVYHFSFVEIMPDGSKKVLEAVQAKVTRPVKEDETEDEEESDEGLSTGAKIALGVGALAAGVAIFGAEEECPSCGGGPMDVDEYGSVKCTECEDTFFESEYVPYQAETDYTEIYGAESFSADAVYITGEKDNRRVTHLYIEGKEDDTGFEPIKIEDKTHSSNASYTNASNHNKKMGKIYEAETFEAGFYQLEVKYNMEDGWEHIADYDNEEDAIGAYYDIYLEHPEVKLLEVDEDGDSDVLYRQRNHDVKGKQRDERFEATTGYGYDDPSERMTDEDGWLELHERYKDDEEWGQMTLEEFKKSFIGQTKKDDEMQIKYEQRLKDEGRDMDGNPIKEAESKNLKLALGITAVGIGLAAVIGKDKIKTLFDRFGL